MAEGACTQPHPAIKPERPSILHPIESPLSWPVRQDPAYDVLVGGAGLAGAVLAQLLADRAGHKVLVVDPRPSLAQIVREEDHRTAPSPLRRAGAGERRRAATYLAQFSRCGPCQGSDVPCIHPAQAAGRLFERLLDHSAIDLLLGAEPAQAAQAYGHQHFVEAALSGTGNEELVAHAFAAFERIVAGSALADSGESEEAIASAA